MSLSAKWLLCFSLISLYVMGMVGLFYYQSSRFDYDEQLKQDTIDMVRNYAPTLIKGLMRKQDAITFDELDVVSRVAKDERVAFLVYLNRYGDVRWFRDSTMIRLRYDEFTKKWPPPTGAVDQAYQTKIPSVQQVPNQPLYEIAIPLAVRGEIQGIVDMQVSRSGVDSIISRKMTRYLMAASVVLVLVGFALYFFVYHFVVNPLLDLRDSIEAISFKNLEVRAQPRKDEIGEISAALQVFLQKVKAELANAQMKERQRGVAEQRWWQSILQTIVAKQHYAIIVDEDNTVLYTNFPIRTATPSTGRLHLLDVLDNQQQDVLRLVGVALDRPNQMVEADTVFRQEPCHVRAVHLEEEGELRRTLILFEPKHSGAGYPR